MPKKAQVTVLPTTTAYRGCVKDAQKGTGKFVTHNHSLPWLCEGSALLGVAHL